MKKNKPNAQSMVNNILVASVVGLALYSAALTYVMLSNQSANESVDRNLAEEVFKLQQ